MKCTKIILRNRNGSKKNDENHCTLSNRGNMYFTTSYQGYSYKLTSRTNYNTPTEDLDPQLTIKTLIFPENISFNTGASLERWSKKTPRLTSAKHKKYIPRIKMLDDEYDFSSNIGEILDNDMSHKVVESQQELLYSENINLNFDEYYVESDIEELILKSKRGNDDCGDNNTPNKRKERNRRNDNKEKNDAKKKRNKFKKTIRFSFSKPASPETEQVIRVDVTSNVSMEEMSQLEIAQNNFKKSSCRKAHKKIINDQIKYLPENFDDNNNTKDSNLNSEGVEEDFIIKCRQLALTQKKR